jgi:hypothetical protein
MVCFIGILEIKILYSFLIYIFMFELHVLATWKDNIKLELTDIHLTSYCQMVCSVGAISDENFIIISCLLNVSNIIKL